MNLQIKQIVQFDAWVGPPTHFVTRTTVYFECGCVITVNRRDGDRADDVLNHTCKDHKEV